MLAVHDSGLGCQLRGCEAVEGAGVVQLSAVDGLSGEHSAPVGDDGQDTPGGVVEAVDTANPSPMPDGYRLDASSPTITPRARRPAVLSDFALTVT